MRQDEGERRHAEDRKPDHILAAEAIAQRSAKDGSGGHREEEDEQHDLGMLDGEVELLHGVERVVTRQATEIDVLRERQRHEHGHGLDDFCPGQCHVGVGGRLAAPLADQIVLIPRPDADQQGDPGKGQHGEPQDMRLAARHHDRRREQRPERRAEIAADLE